MLIPRESDRAFWWVIVIFLGVFIGNLLTFGAYEIYVRWKLDQFVISLKSEAAEQAESSKAEMKRVAKSGEALRREREKQNAIIAKLLQTCEFWRQQVAKENTSQNQAYRDAACSRASSSVR